MSTINIAYKVLEIYMGDCSDQNYHLSNNVAVVNSSYFSEELCIAPKAELKVVTQDVKREKTWKATLTFSTTRDFCGRSDLKRKAYKVVTDNGTFLVGSKDAPFPITKVTRGRGGNITGNLVSQVNVTWLTDKPLPVLAES